MADDLRPNRIVFLDQFVYSSMAKKASAAYERAFALLSELTAVQLWMCPSGLGHWVETSFEAREDRRRDYFRVIQHLQRLRMFQSPCEIELLHATRAFSAFLEKGNVEPLTLRDVIYPFPAGTIIMPMYLAIDKDLADSRLPTDEYFRASADDSYGRLSKGRWLEETHSRKEIYEEEVAMNVQMFREVLHRLAGWPWKESYTALKGDVVYGAMHFHGRVISALISMAYDKDVTFELIDEFLKSPHFREFAPFDITAWLYGAMYESNTGQGRAIKKGGAGDLRDAQNVAYSLPWVTDIFVDKHFENLLKIRELRPFTQGKRIWTHRTLDEFISEAESARQSTQFGRHQELFRRMSPVFWPFMRALVASGGLDQFHPDGNGTVRLEA